MTWIQKGSCPYTFFFPLFMTLYALALPSPIQLYVSLKLSTVPAWPKRFAPNCFDPSLRRLKGYSPILLFPDTKWLYLGTHCHVSVFQLPGSYTAHKLYLLRTQMFRYRLTLTIPTRLSCTWVHLCKGCTHTRYTQDVEVIAKVQET